MNRVLLTALLMMAAAPCLATECSVAVADMSFDDYSPYDGAPGESTSVLTVTCRDNGNNDTANYTVSLSTGQAASYAPRGMFGPGMEMVQYNVYTDPGGNEIWGDGSPGTVTVMDSIDPPLGGEDSNSHLAHGVIPPDQSDLPPGTYTDVITITLSLN